MSEELLPLFPLQAVLFPRSLLPLHIFEDRYRVLIKECIASSGEFGVNLIGPGQPQAVGCSAAVRDVLRTYDDGRLDVVVEGRRRYTLIRQVPAPAPYAVGAVEFMEEPDEEVEPGLAREAIEMHNRLVDTVYRGSARHVDPAACDPGVSFLLAQKAGLELQLRQRLLETLSENDRLRALLAYLRETLPKLERLEEVERIVKSDGYI